MLEKYTKSVSILLFSELRKIRLKLKACQKGVEMS